MILFIYASLIFLVLRFSVTLFNFLSNPKLGYYGRHFNDKVSVIFLNPSSVDIPAFSLKAEDYVNVEILVKESEEERLPDLIQRVSGRYFLLIRGDVVLTKGFINNLICRAKLYDLAMISIVPHRKFANWYGYCFYPLQDFLLMSVFPMRLFRLVNIPAFSVASQSCMFFDTEAYRKGMGQGSGCKTKMELLHANKFAVLHEPPFPAHLGKNLLKVFGNSFFAALIYVVLVVAGPIVMFLNFQSVFLVLPLGLIFLMRIMSSFLSGQSPVFNTLLHPLQLLVLLVLLVREAALKLLTTLRHKN